MDQRRIAEEALHACLRVQRANVQWSAGIRTGLLVTVALLVGLALGRVDEAMSVSIGLLFIAIADPTDSRPTRLRVMLWATLWISVGVLLGGLVSGTGIVHVGVAIVLALACGYAGALGPRGGLIGVLTLVLFAFYAGAPVVVDDAVLDTGYFIVGGLITIAANLLLAPPRRLGAVRSAMAHCYRELQDAAHRRGIELAAPTVAAAVMSARSVIDHAGCVDATRAWAEALLSGAERTRLALLALISERSRNTDFVDDLTRRLSATSRAVADSLAAPLGLPADRRRARARTALADLEACVEEAPDPQLAVLARDIADAMAAVVRVLDGPWPLGSRAQLAPPRPTSSPVMPRLRSHLHIADAVTEHALRLTIAFGGATLAAVIVDVSHAYWLPLTVAWIAKPDLANTVSRVAMRIVGTIIGLVVTTGVLLIASRLPSEDVILCITIGVTGALSLAYLNANYPLAVVGITSFVLLVEHVTGDGEEYDVVARLLATTLAGLWVLLIASIRPRRTGATAVAAMHATNAALRDYATVARQGADSSEARARVLRERTIAIAAVSAAAMETPGLWERPGGRVDPVQAAAIIADIIGATSAILAEELLEEHGQADDSLWGRITTDLDDLDARVDALTQPAGSGSVP